MGGVRERLQRPFLLLSHRGDKKAKDPRFGLIHTFILFFQNYSIFMKNSG